MNMPKLFSKKKIITTLTVLAAIIKILEWAGVKQASYITKPIWQSILSIYLTLVNITFSIQVTAFTILYGVVIIIILFFTRQWIFRIPRWIFQKTRNFRQPKESILDLMDARFLAQYCFTPRTTADMRRRYDTRQRQSSVIFVGGYNFDDYLKKLEKEGMLKQDDSGKWYCTEKAKKYIEKYHGY